MSRPGQQLREAVLRYDPTAALRVACVGDSITYGYRGGLRRSANAYPVLLRELLSGSRYSVANLGNSGKTASKQGRDGGIPGSPASYWKTSEFAELRANPWDAVVIMLGTNDAKDRSSRGSNNWQHEGCDTDASATSCSYWHGLAGLVRVARRLPRTRRGSGHPEIFMVVPPPLPTSRPCSTCAPIRWWWA